MERKADERGSYVHAIYSVPSFRSLGHTGYTLFHTPRAGARLAENAAWIIGETEEALIVRGYTTRYEALAAANFRISCANV